MFKNFFNKINMPTFLQSKKYFQYFRHLYPSIILHFNILFFDISIFGIFFFRYFPFEIIIFRSSHLSIFFCKIFRHFYHSTKLGLTVKFSLICLFSWRKESNERVKMLFKFIKSINYLFYFNLNLSFFV